MIRNGIPKTIMNTDNLLYFNNNYNKNYIDYSINNYNNSQISDNNYLKNILQKKKEKYNILNINNQEKKNSIINDYIYKNITKINRDNIIKKHMNNNSILSKEANKLIKDFNIKQREKGKMNNKGNILINRTFNNNNFDNKYNNLEYKDYFFNILPYLYVGDIDNHISYETKDIKR